ncbi:MAG: Ig-like domain-containing protein [bacterium]
MLTFGNRPAAPIRPLWKEGLVAAFVTLPLLGLPLLAGIGFYGSFWWQLVTVFVLGGVADVIYCLTLRRLLTPALHPSRIHLRWLLAGPLLALLLLWLLHVQMLVAAGIALLLILAASFVMGRALIWDALASALGFGIFYVALYYFLSIPVVGPVETISSFSGIVAAGHPIEEIAMVFLFGALWGPVCAAYRLPTDPEHTDPFHRRHHFMKQVAVFVFAVAVAGGTYWTYDSFIRLPVANAAAPTDGTQLESLVAPITVTFDRPINRSQIEVTLSPPVKGDISFADSYLQRIFVRQLIFTPSQHLEPGTTYTLRITHLANVLSRENSDYSLTFKTPALPSVKNVSVSADSKQVGICDPITVTLNESADHVAEFSFQMTPAIDLTSALSSDGKTYTLTPKGCLDQSTDYSLAVKRVLTIYGEDGTLRNSTDLPVTVATASFTTKGAPGISGFTPQGGGVLLSQKSLTLTFSEAMASVDPTSQITVQPAVAGTWKWVDNKTLVYTMTGALQLDTKYTVTVAKGLKDAHEGFLPDAASFTFTTIGHVRVSSITPRSGSGGVSVGTPIKVAFDQPVDHDSAQQAFSISPAVAGTFSWSGQTMSYAASLSKDAGYQVTVAAGVVSQIGLPSTSVASSSFQTEESSTLLSIPVYYQQKPLSCEAASLTMALRYKGVGVSEATVLGALPVDTTPRSGNVWGDPYAAFVGDVNGHQDSTGYGVYTAPIANVANQYRSSQILTLSAASVASNIAAGNPVVFWGVAGSNPRPDPWVTPAGRAVNGWIGEHVRLLVGFTGPVAHPTGFIINDPIFGRLHWTTAQLQSNWSAFGAMGVVVF